MIGPECAHAVAVIGEEVAAGATRTRACAEVGIDRRTLRRWTSGEASGSVTPISTKHGRAGGVAALLVPHISAPTSRRRRETKLW